MALTKGITRKFEVPHEEDQWVELRQLNYRQLQEARRTKLDDLFGLLRSMKDVQLPTAADPSAPADPLAGYDIGTLLQHGIVAWSYGPEVTPDDLDERTAIWVGREVVALSIPDEATVGKG